MAMRIPDDVERQAFGTSAISSHVTHPETKISRQQSEMCLTTSHVWETGNDFFKKITILDFYHFLCRHENGRNLVTGKI